LDLRFRVQADLATLGYNSRMANDVETNRIALRGCGSLSPLDDEALTCAASLHRDQPRSRRVPTRGGARRSSMTPTGPLCSWPALGVLGERMEGYR